MAQWDIIEILISIAFKWYRVYGVSTQSPKKQFPIIVKGIVCETEVVQM
jgi:hypothetical protein